MSNIKKSDVQKLTDLAGISIGVRDGGPFPTVAQLKVLIELVRGREQARCAAICRDLHESASHMPDGLKRVGEMAMATQCAKSIEAPAVAPPPELKRSTRK